MDMTPGRRLTLALSMPVALALIGWGGFSVVAEVGTGQYAFNTPLTVTGGTLTVNTPGDELTVVPGQVARLSGTLTYSLVRPDITVSRSGVSARCVIPTGQCDGNGTLTVPPSAASVDVSTAGGDLTLDTGITSNVTLSTDGGDLSASGLTGTARLSSEGGDISAPGIASSDVTASSSGGDITLKFSKVPHDVQVTSDGGDISIVVPHGSYQFDVSTDGGTPSAPASDPGASDIISATSSGGDVTISES